MDAFHGSFLPSQKVFSDIDEQLDRWRKTYALPQSTTAGSAGLRHTSYSRCVPTHTTSEHDDRFQSEQNPGAPHLDEREKEAVGDGTAGVGSSSAKRSGGGGGGYESATCSEKVLTGLLERQEVQHSAAVARLGEQISFLMRCVDDLTEEARRTRSEHSTEINRLRSHLENTVGENEELKRRVSSIEDLIRTKLDTTADFAFTRGGGGGGTGSPPGTIQLSVTELASLLGASGSPSAFSAPGRSGLNNAEPAAGTLTFSKDSHLHHAGVIEHVSRIQHQMDEERSQFYQTCREEIAHLRQEMASKVFQMELKLRETGKAQESSQQQHFDPTAASKGFSSHPTGLIDPRIIDDTMVDEGSNKRTPKKEGEKCKSATPQKQQSAGGAVAISTVTTDTLDGFAKKNEERKVTSGAPQQQQQQRSQEWRRIIEEQERAQELQLEELRRQRMEAEMEVVKRAKQEREEADRRKRQKAAEEEEERKKEAERQNAKLLQKKQEEEKEAAVKKENQAAQVTPQRASSKKEEPKSEERKQRQAQEKEEAEEAKRKKKEAYEEEFRKKEAEARQRQKAAEEEAARKKKEMDEVKQKKETEAAERKRKEAEDEAERKRLEEEQIARKKREEEEEKKKEKHSKNNDSDFTDSDEELALPLSSGNAQVPATKLTSSPAAAAAATPGKKIVEASGSASGTSPSTAQGRKDEPSTTASPAPKVARSTRLSSDSSSEDVDPFVQKLQAQRKSQRGGRGGTRGRGIGSILPGAGNEGTSAAAVAPNRKISPSSGKQRGAGVIVGDTAAVGGGLSGPSGFDSDDLDF